MLAALGAAVFGGSAMSNAQSAVHEIEALISFLIVVVCCGAGLVASAVDEAAKRIAPDKPKAAPPPIPQNPGAR